MSSSLRSRRKPTDLTPSPQTPSFAPDRAPDFHTTPQHASAPAEQVTLEPSLADGALVPIPFGHSFANISLFDPTSAAPPPPPPPAPSTAHPLIQAALRVNAPDDPFEHEADRVADLVLRMPALHPAPAPEPQPPPTAALSFLSLQRSSHDAGLETSPAIEADLAQLQGGGQPLPEGERAFFEQRFGHDFSQVRIHTDSHAAQTSRDLNARAFTVGSDIAFDAGEYQPGTDQGRQLLAHELTHTIQQTGGLARKSVQRATNQDQPDDAEEASDQQAPPTEQALTNLVAEAQQTLSDSEVAQQPVAPLEAQPLALPEVTPEDNGASGGAGAAAAPAPAQETAPLDTPAAASAAATTPAASASAPASAAPAADVLAPATLAPNEPAPAPPQADAAALGAPAPDKGSADQAATNDQESAAPAQPTSSATAAAPPQSAQPPHPADAPAPPGQQDAQARQPSADEQQDAQARQPSADQQSQTTTSDAARDQSAQTDEDEDTERQRVQRLPATRLIQRTPRSPDADPAFQAVLADVNATAAQHKQHQPAQHKANQVAAAASMPPEEKLGLAQNSQATTIDAAASQQAAAASGHAPGFDKAAFKASIKARIDELTPQDPKQMEDIEGSGVFSNVHSTVDTQVQAGKQQAQGHLDDKVAENPNVAAVADKPVTPLQPNAPGAQPGAVAAAGAAPKPHEPAQVEQPLVAQSQQLDAQMQQAQVTPQQLQHSNEPSFQAALQAKTDAQTHAQQALPAYRSQEQAQIASAQAEATTITQGGVSAMFSSRSGVFTQMDTLQQGGQGKDEQRRAEIGRQIDGIYQSTKTAVEGILSELDQAVDAAFTSGAEAAKQAAVDYIKRETAAYKAQRYGEDGGVLDYVGGLWNRGQDALLGMPDEYYQYYRQGRDLYVQQMEAVLDRVAEIVGSQLKRAHERVEQGRDEISKFVASQPEELRQVAQEVASDAQSKFDELDQTVDAKQSEIVDQLAQQYVEKLQALESELEQMQEAEKGLLAKASDLIGGVIETITELKNLLLNTLSRAAGAVMRILEQPIEFLGNLLSAVGQGLRQFVGNIGTHLQAGLIGWLTGALAAGGIQLPATWDLQGIFSLVMQILGLTYAQIRARIMQALGPIGAQVIGALEQAWEVFQIIQSEGLGGLWRFIMEQVGDLQAMVLDQIKEMVITQVIKAGIEWLVGILGGPAGAFIKAVQGIVRVVRWLVENAARLASLVNTVLDSVMAIAAGDVGGAASFIEQSLAKALPSVISFLAELLGLGGISHKVQEIIEKVRAPIEKAITWLVQKAVALGKKIWGMLGGKGGRRADSETDVRTREEKQRDLDLAIAEAEGMATKPDATKAEVDRHLPSIKQKYHLSELKSVISSSGTYYIHGEVNPSKNSEQYPLDRETKYIKDGHLKPEYQGKEKIRARFYGANKGYNAEARRRKDELVREYTDPKNPDNWIDPNNGVSVPKTDVTIEHDPSVSWHWNNMGYDTEQQTRRDWYTFVGRLDELKIMSRSQNSSDGANEPEYRSDVGPNFRGPDER